MKEKRPMSILVKSLRSGFNNKILKSTPQHADSQKKVLESYTNSEAVLFHFDNLESFKVSLSESRTFVSLEVYGNASEELKERVKKINAEHFTAISYLNKLS